MSETVVVKTVQELRVALGNEVRRISGIKVMDRLGYTAKRIIEERTVVKHQDAAGEELPSYSTRPTYISLKDRPVPRGGIKTPQTRRRISLYNAKYGARESLRNRSRANASKRGGKSMFFPGGYRQYKANLYGSRRNLTKTGYMFMNLRWKAEEKKVTLYFATDETNKKAYYNNEVAEFFAIGQIREETEALVAVVEGSYRGK